MLNRVYHGSNIQGLKIIRPSKSTHRQEWVYATKDPVICALFLSGIGGDFTCQVGRDAATGLPYVCERFNGAFSFRYEGKRGSIYVLPGKGFLRGKTSWEEEVVCPFAVQPIGEILVPDVSKYLAQMAEQRKLILKHFPQKIDDIPEDDSDLVQKAVLWTKRSGKHILGQVERYHPHLLKIIKMRLEEELPDD